MAPFRISILFPYLSRNGKTLIQVNDSSSPLRDRSYRSNLIQLDSSMDPGENRGWIATNSGVKRRIGRRKIADFARRTQSLASVRLRNCRSRWQLCPRSLTCSQIYEAALRSQEEERMNNGAPGPTQRFPVLFAVCPRNYRVTCLIARLLSSDRYRSAV